MSENSTDAIKSFGIITVFEKVRTDNTIYSGSDGKWCGETDYVKVWRITMTAGGKSWYEYLTDATSMKIQKAFQTNLPLRAKTWDNRTVLLSPNYIVQAEEFTIVSKMHRHTKADAEHGNIRYYYLFPQNVTEVNFINE